MGLTDLASSAELDAFLKQHNVCLVTFSAHWCGPCKASKPKLDQLANELQHVPFGYTYESDLGEYLHTFQVRAFPTNVCFVAGKEVDRVVGVNFAGIQEMLSKHAGGSGGAVAIPESGGHALGGGGDGTKMTPEEARNLMLAKLEATASASASAAKPMDEGKPAAETPTPMETEEPAPAAAAPAKEDATMTEAGAGGAASKSTNAVDHLDEGNLKTLIEEMGFTELRAQKGLMYSSQGTVESSVEWLMEHQDDADIDEPIPDGAKQIAQSYKCNDCGKVFSNMANLELHANKTGHSDFEESTEVVKPLTAEEKAIKIAKIKELLKDKRAEREEVEKVDNVEREKQRRSMGKEVAKTREQMDMEQRKRDTRERKREKNDAKRERERIRKELEKDKMERIANKGRLSSKLGVDGYNPDAIQYDKDDGGEEPAAQKPKRVHEASTAKIDEYIQKISSYRAGGDGGKCLKILKAYVGNVADNPTEEKFKTINTENKTFKTKVKPFVGAKQLLAALGFTPKKGDPTFLCLKEGADPQVLADTKTKLEKAMAAYG
jgi:thiol-disulfide isomerase/thioredoxin